jgi:opacity protein-like surface antigen
MKKAIILSTLTLLTFSTTSFAQKGFHIGVQGAPQLSMMNNADNKDDKTIELTPAFGVSFGINGGYNFNKNMGIATEVVYSIQGQKYTVAGVDMTQRVNYLKVPVLFSYNTNPASKVMFTAKAGPQIGIKLSSKVNDGDGETIIDDTNEKFEDLTFGATAGAGARINLAKNLFLDAGLRFDYAFTNAENEDYIGYPTGRATTYNMNAGVEVGLKYFLN